MTCFVPVDRKADAKSSTDSVVEDVGVGRPGNASVPSLKQAGQTYDMEVREQSL